MDDFLCILVPNFKWVAALMKKINFYLIFCLLRSLVRHMQNNKIQIRKKNEETLITYWLTMAKIARGHWSKAPWQIGLLFQLLSTPPHPSPGLPTKSEYKYNCTKNVNLKVEDLQDMGLWCQTTVQKVCFLSPKFVLRWRWSSNEDCLPSRSSYIEDCLPSKVIFHQMSSSINSNLPSKFCLKSYHIIQKLFHGMLIHISSFFFLNRWGVWSQDPNGKFHCLNSPSLRSYFLFEYFILWKKKLLKVCRGNSWPRIVLVSPGGACTARGSRNGVGEWVGEWVRSKFFLSKRPSL